MNFGMLCCQRHSRSRKAFPAFPNTTPPPYQEKSKMKKRGIRHETKKQQMAADTAQAKRHEPIHAPLI